LEWKNDGVMEKTLIQKCSKQQTEWQNTERKSWKTTWH